MLRLTMISIDQKKKNLLEKLSHALLEFLGLFLVSSYGILLDYLILFVSIFFFFFLFATEILVLL